MTNSRATESPTATDSRATESPTVTDSRVTESPTPTDSRATESPTATNSRVTESLTATDSRVTESPTATEETIPETIAGILSLYSRQLRHSLLSISANIKTNAPPTKHVKSEAVQRGEQVTKHVDTRGSYVNLDKYNEKYETIASTESGNRRQNDAYTKKQKISQKSQKGKQQFSKKKETEAQKLKRS